jgi:hypothetical protein
MKHNSERPLYIKVESNQYQQVTFISWLLRWSRYWMMYFDCYLLYYVRPYLNCQTGGCVTLVNLVKSDYEEATLECDNT